MVCRFVQKEYVGTRQEDFRQLDAHAPAPAEFPALPIQVLQPETQAFQHHFHFLVDVALPTDAEQLRLFVYFVQQFHIVRGIVILPPCQFHVEPLHLVLQGKKVSKSLFGFLAHGIAVSIDLGLWQVTDSYVGSHGDAALRRLLQPRQHFQGCRFAGAIAPGQTDAVFLVNQKRNPVQQIPPSKDDTNIIYRYHNSSFYQTAAKLHKFIGPDSIFSPFPFWDSALFPYL